MLNLNDYFDDFTIHSRVMPVLVAIFPMLIFTISQGFNFSGLQESVIYTLLLIAFIAFTSKICREFGKRYEEKMYKKLKGMPTTIVARFSDTTIDNKTKARYHFKLNEKVDDLKLPLSLDDETKDSDIEYVTAMNWLRKYANTNRDKEQRVYQELKEYNFWRNLYGIKIICLIVYILTTIQECIIITDFSFKELFSQPYPKYNLFIFLLSYLILFSIVVNKKTVEKKAFDYAKTLLEVCDNL